MVTKETNADIYLWAFLFSFISFLIEQMKSQFNFSFILINAQYFSVYVSVWLSSLVL